MLTKFLIFDLIKDKYFKLSFKMLENKSNYYILKLILDKL